MRALRLATIAAVTALSISAASAQSFPYDGIDRANNVSVNHAPGQLAATTGSQFPQAGISTVLASDNSAPVAGYASQFAQFPYSNAPNGAVGSVASAYASSHNAAPRG